MKISNDDFETSRGGRTNIYIHNNQENEAVVLDCVGLAQACLNKLKRFMKLHY